MGPKSILIIGNYGAGNLGDDAILAGILTDLRAVGYRGKLTVTHGGQSSSSDLYKNFQKVPFVPAGIRSHFSSKRRQAQKAIQNADLVILGGGGLFTDSESRWAPWIWAIQAHACQKARVPYICYGQSVGPLKTWWGKSLARAVFQKALAIHVRDEASERLLKNWGIKSVLGSDPALSWLQQAREKCPKKPILLVAFRLWPEVDTLTWNELLRPILDYAAVQKWKPILVAMDEANELERAALAATGLEVFEPTSAAFAFQGFQKAHLAITMRLHGGIFALAAGLPTLALSYSPKVSSFFKTLGAKNGVKILERKDWTPKNVERELKSLKEAPRFDAETPIMENQNFLRKVLLDIA